MATIPEIKELSELLKETLEDVEVVNYTAKALTAPGDNYGSLILAVDIVIKENAKEKVLHTVAKLLPPYEFLKSVFGVQVTVPKELHMYSKVAPALLNLQKEYGISENELLNLFPKFYGGRLNIKGGDQVDDDSIILLENLKLLGYDTGNRTQGLDLAETQLVLKGLARFHAVPIALKILKPEVFKNVVLPVLKPNNFGDKNFHNDMTRYAEEWKGFLESDETCRPYLEALAESGRRAPLFEETFKNPKEPYATIVHNDTWVNNIMILKENGKPISVKFVDYQVTAYGSPVRDIMHFMFTSIDDEVLENNYDELIDLYYKTFIECLKEFDLDTEPFTRELLDDEFKEYGPYECGHIAFMLRAVLTDKEKMKQANVAKRGVLTTEVTVPRYIPKLRNTVHEFIRRKWL